MNKVKSSHIESLHYDEPTKVLTVRFNNGSEYQYSGVPSMAYRLLNAAPSKGTHFAANIKNKYLSKKIK